MIETETLLLRPINIGDNKQVFSYRSDAEANKYQGFVPKKLKEVDEFIGNNPLELNVPESWFQIGYC